MPIVAIEGPNLSGKSTMVHELLKLYPKFVFVPGLPLRTELLPVMAAAEERSLALWEALYDPRHVYLCDRHPAVSEAVYSQLNHRKSARIDPEWRNRIFLVYLRPSLAELNRRLLARGDAFATPSRLQRELDLYDEVSSDFPWRRIISEANPIQVLTRSESWREVETRLRCS